MQCPPTLIQTTHMKKSTEELAIKVMIVEDPMCARGAFEICNLINQSNSFSVNARVTDLEDAQRALHIFSPDVIFIDLHSIHPRIALGLGESLKGISPLLKVVFASENPPPVLSGNMNITALSGWAYWLNKSITPPDDIAGLVGLLRQVVLGDIAIPEQLRDEFISNHDFLSNLSIQQRITIDLLAQGYSNKEIARVANLNLKSVERNISKATEILGINGIEHENNKRILLVLEYLRRINRSPTFEMASN